MAGMFSSLFGKKMKKNNKAISRRLELLGLEERITPATISVNGNNEVVIQLNGETITDLSTSINGNLITINTAGSANNTGLGVGLTVNNNSVVVDTAVLTGFAGIQVTESTSDNAVTVGATGVDLSTAPGGANQGFSINLSSGGISQTSNVNGVIKAKGTGLVTLNLANNGLTISAAGDITTAAGAVSIAATNLDSAGDVTTGSGNISFGSALNPVGDMAINSTTGNVSFGIVTASSKNLSVTTGGSVSMTNSINLVSGNLAVSGGGDVTFSNAVTAGSVNAKSTTGDVIFANTVTTSQVGGFTSEATLSTKATKIANFVDVQNGASALVTGNLVSGSASSAVIQVDGTGTINITGKVDAASAGNDISFNALNGSITIGGAVGSGATAMGDLLVNGNTSFTASGAVAVDNLDIGFSRPFASSVSFAEAVKVTGSTGVVVTTTGTGTISFAKTIEATNVGGAIELTSVNGALTVTGNIIGKNDVVINSTSGAISVAGITTDNADGDVIILNGTGNITTSGAISTSGATADIKIDTVTSGNITIGGNVSTSGGGAILLGADTTTSASGTGNLTINGTVSTTGSFSGDVAIGTGGTGTVTVNKAISSDTGNIFLLALGNQTNALNFSKDATITSGVGVVFSTTGPANTISLASGANITAVEGVSDDISGTGILNLASNINVTNPSFPTGIQLDNVSINLTGPVSMNVASPSNPSNGLIRLRNVNGAQNLTLEATGVITLLGSVGQSTPLGTVTVTNSAGVNSNIGLSAASLVLTDTTGSISFSGTTVISKSLTTAAKNYNLNFSGTTTIAGNPVFLNTKSTIFSGTTSFSSGATILGDATTVVGLDGTIVSDGAFNIGVPGNTGLVDIFNNTQLILNSSSATSTIANPIGMHGVTAGTLNLLGVGTLSLSGDSSASTISGDIINVTNGTLNVTGKVASTIALTNGTLSGAGGTTGAVTSTIGNVTPGGTLKTGAVSLNGATNYNVAITGNGSASNLETLSAINLGSAVLNLPSVAGGLYPGSQLVIINNTAASTTPIQGTFANLPEGATLSAVDTLGNTVNFAISYVGGAGNNDAVLTITSIQVANPSVQAQPMVLGQQQINKMTVIGADAGGGPEVTLTLNIVSGLTVEPTYFSFFAYDVGFTGGVRVALGDLDGSSSTLEIITAPGAGGGPNIRVFQFDVATLTFNPNPVNSFFAFGGPAFGGGAYVTAGDVNGDGLDDVIVGAGAGGGPRVQVFAGSLNGLVTSAPVNDFFAYSTAFTGGVVVAAGNRDGNLNGIDQVVTGPASNGGYHIQSFDCNGTGNNPTVVESFFAFNDSTSIGGLSLAVGFLDINPVEDIVVGTTNTQFGVILNQNYGGGILATPFEGFDGAIRSGVAVDQNGVEYAVAAAGPGGGPVIAAYGLNGNSLSQTDLLFVLNQQFRGGLFMATTLSEFVN